MTQPSAHKHHRLRSPIRRAVYSFLLVAVVMVVGTLGIHHIERMTYVQAFYFMSMIATAQGPPVFGPVTPAGMIFTSIMSFVSVGAVVTALGFLFGPFFGRLWRVGVIKLEEELEHIKHDK